MQGVGFDEVHGPVSVLVFAHLTKTWTNARSPHTLRRWCSPQGQV